MCRKATDEVEAVARQDKKQGHTSPAWGACTFKLCVSFLRVFFPSVGTFAVVAWFSFAHTRGAVSTDQQFQPVGLT